MSVSREKRKGVECRQGDIYHPEPAGASELNQYPTKNDYDYHRSESRNQEPMVGQDILGHVHSGKLSHYLGSNCHSHERQPLTPYL